LLSDKHRQSPLTFTGRFRNNWGLGAGSYLLIIYDEKWFWGLVTRRGAKACKELGIEQQSFQAYHKNHINKVMAIAFTEFAFVDCIDNGGCAEKLALIRAQGKKVLAARMQRKSVKQPNGLRILGKSSAGREMCTISNVQFIIVKKPAYQVHTDHVSPTKSACNFGVGDLSSRLLSYCPLSIQIHQTFRWRLQYK
jgi:hypothetical protein